MWLEKANIAVQMHNLFPRTWITQAQNCNLSHIYTTNVIIYNDSFFIHYLVLPVTCVINMIVIFPTGFP